VDLGTSGRQDRLSRKASQQKKESFDKGRRRGEGAPRRNNVKQSRRRAAPKRANLRTEVLKALKFECWNSGKVKGECGARKLTKRGGSLIRDEKVRKRIAYGKWAGAIVEPEKGWPHKRVQSLSRKNQVFESGKKVRPPYAEYWRVNRTLATKQGFFKELRREGEGNVLANKERKRLTRYTLDGGCWNEIRYGGRLPDVKKEESESGKNSRTGTWGL